MAQAPYHSGEREVQARAGVRRGSDRVASIFRDSLPEVAQAFLSEQRMAVLAGEGTDGRAWASLLAGEPGFLQTPDARHLVIDAGSLRGDPLEHLDETLPAGLLAIDLGTRQRMKVKGPARLERDAMRLHLTVERTYALCPKYIQKRQPEELLRDNDSARARIHTPGLAPAQEEWIRRADTFFIASLHPQVGADASHRGGAPGFVHVEEQRIVFPDYAGNNMFNTLGNIQTDPRVGLLFLDFAEGKTLQVSGRARILWDREKAAVFAGAQRLVEVEVEEAMEGAGRLPARWRLLEPSPFNPR